MPSGDKPLFSVSVGGTDVTGNFDDRLLEFELTDNSSESDEITFKIDDRDFAVTLPQRGDTMTVAIGYADTGLVDKGTFEVSDVSGEGPPYEITVHGKSASQRSDQKTQRIKNHKDKSLKDVASDIAQNNGLQDSVGDFDDIKWDTLNQSEESDWHILQRYSRMFDATFAVKNGTLIFQPASSGMNGSGESLPTLEINDPSGLLRYEFQSGDRPKHSKVEASWYDRKTGKRKREKVDLSSDDGAVAEHKIRHLHYDQTHAQKAAKAKGDKLQRSEGSCSIEITGDPTVAAEGNMTINVGRPGLDGEWIIKTVVHTYNEDRGYVTKITGETKSGVSSSGDAQ